MQKYFTSVFTDKRIYGLSQYNVEVCTWDEILSRVRLEKCERSIILMPSGARLEIILKK